MNIRVSSVYKDNESDGYRVRPTRYGMNGIGFLPPLGGGTAPGSIQGSSPGASCAPCPTGCRTEKRTEVYYARPQRISDSDVQVKVARKVVKCEEVNSTPTIDCNQTSVNGLSGCGSCYSNRM